jgi:hypothetical protein
MSGIEKPAVVKERGGAGSKSRITTFKKPEIRKVRTIRARAGAAVEKTEGGAFSISSRKQTQGITEV